MGKLKTVDSKNIIINNWVGEFSNFIAQESLKLVISIGKPKNLISELSTKLVHYYIKALIKDSLTAYEKMNLSRQDEYEFTAKNFADLKYQLQIEVASAFESAAKEFSGKTVDYYCTISPVPDPINKEAC